MERVTRRNFFRLAAYGGIALLVPEFVSCGKQDQLNFNFLREKGTGVLTKEEALEAAHVVQKKPGENVKKNGKWLEELVQGQITLKATSSFLANTPLTLLIQETKTMFGKPALATTTFLPNPTRTEYKVEIMLHPKVLAGSNEVISLSFAKEFQNIRAAARSAREHGNFFNTSTEEVFWKFFTDERNPGSFEGAIVLVDGRAYWEMLDDYRQVLVALGGDYKRLKRVDQELLGSWSRLARFALSNELLVERNSRWIQNPQFTIPGYITKKWADYLVSLFTLN